MNEQRLLMGGIESNLGPMEKVFYEGWTCDASRFLWPSIVAVEMTLSSRTKRLLKYFDPRSKGGSLVFARVNAILSKSLDEWKQQYYLDHDGPITQDMRWDCVKRNLDALFPTIFALDAEAKLKGMSKDSKESLLQFPMSFSSDNAVVFPRLVEHAQGCSYLVAKTSATHTVEVGIRKI